MDAAIRVVRIDLHEADQGHRRSLVKEILDVLRANGSHGVTVFRAVAGVDENGEIYASDMIRSLLNLPEKVEFFDSPDRVEATLAQLAGIVPAGRTVVWDATCR